tara:strand:+ start:1928 stop:3016 length:1089 start_codon:yes stop_codon:yes gene_type:complete
MKILFDYQIFNLQKFGGISKYYYNLSLNLAKKNINSEIYSPIFKNFYGKDLMEKKLLKGKYIENYPRLTSKLIDKINLYLSNIYLKKYNPDIFHITYFNNKYKKFSNVKNIITVYDLIHEKYSDYYKKDFHSKINSLNNADHIICISENTKKDLLDYYNIENDKVTTIHLGVDQENHNINKIRRDKKFILYVGDRNKYKNFKNFILAYSKSEVLKNNFDVLCFGGNKFNKNEIKSFEELKIPRNSIFQVSGDDKTLKSYYLAAEFLIIPSLYEGFGLPLLEAMSLNCPVLCSKNSSLLEIGGDAAIFFDPQDYEDIKNTMEKFINNTTDRNEIIQKGILNSQKYTWENCANKTLKVYKEVIK